jgi:hypothetical protein
MGDSMKRLCVLIIAVTLFSMLLFACGQSQNEINATSPIYKVTQSTGLYSAFEIDADQIAVVPVGAILVPADDNTTLFCDKFSEAGMTYTLCKVKFSATGQTGWVLKQFIEMN